MAVYLVNVYSLSDDFIKEFPGIIIHQEQVEEEKYRAEYFGKIYIKVEKGQVTANELKTDDPIPIFVKADQEDLYFPQPKDTTNVKDAIRTYKMCLYTLDRDIKPENLVNKSQIPEEELSEKNYLYYKLLDIKNKKEKNIKNEEKVNQQVKKLSKNK